MIRQRPQPLSECHPWASRSAARPEDPAVGLQPERREEGRPKGSGKLGLYREILIETVKAKPDITMPELAAWMEGEHRAAVECAPSPVY